MATIDMRRRHTLSREEAKKRAEELATSMQQKLGIQWHWQGDDIHFDTPSGAAKGVGGEVDVSDSEVRVQINLPFLLRAIKGTVEGKVREKLDTIIGTT